MKTYHTILASILLSSSVSAMADTGVFVGFVYNFGPNAGPGLSIKVTSDDEEDKLVAALGISYLFKGPRRVGIDLGAGYTFKNGLVTGGYDFVNGVPQFGVGYMDTDDETAPAPAPVILPPTDSGDDGSAA